MLFALLAVVGVILYCGFKNIAAATPEQVYFNPVTIRNGAKIHVNGDKTLTAIDNGNKLFADNTLGIFAANDYINGYLGEFSSRNYANDALFNNSATGEATLPDQASIEKYSSLLPSVRYPYWLNNYKEAEIYAYRDYDNGNNTLDINRLSISGRNSDYEYDDTVVANGPYAFTKDIRGLEDYTKLTGGEYSVSGSKLLSLTRYVGDRAWLDRSGRIYNNPYLRSSGQRTDGITYGYTHYILSDRPYNDDIVGVINKGKSYRLERPYDGQYIPKGSTVAVVAQTPGYDSWEDVSNFKVPDLLALIENGWSQEIPRRAYIGFVETSAGCIVHPSNEKTDANWALGNMNYWPAVIVGSFVDNNSYLRNDKEVKATSYFYATKDIRPVFTFDTSEVAFIREAASNEILSSSSSFTNAPLSVGNLNVDSKVVVESDATTLNCNIDDSKLSTEKSLNGHAETKFSENKIMVPRDAKTLTIKASAFDTNNANYISALADSSGTKKYALLGEAGEDISIDLASILNINELGSSATVSFYAEQANGENTSDSISKSPGTVKIEVVEGPEQTIKYNLGGGTGMLPETVVVRAGNSHTLADGAGFTLDGNLFSRWQLTYTNFGDMDETSVMVKGNEAIVVPDTSNGTITATAMYSGFGTKKSTDSSPTVYTVTWDTNSPDGFSATFASSDAGTFNDSRTQRYDKVKDLAVNSVPVPGSPEINTNARIFDGWFTDPVGGEKVEISVNVTQNVIYYAHWFDGYKVIYDASGGDDAEMSGFFVNNVTVEDHKILPGNKTFGPDNGDPTPDNSEEYMFYGWYTKPNGNGSKLDTVSGVTINESITYYAYFGPAYTFLAPAGSTLINNPRDIDGKISLSKVKMVASLIANGETNPLPEIYNDTNDKYHLYTLLRSSRGNYLDVTNADNWAEFRIIHIGNHDNDRTGITFQAIHELPKAYQMNVDENFVEWSETGLSKMMSDGGEIFAMFDTHLTSDDVIINVVEPSAKGRLWIASYSELTGDRGGYRGSGSQYNYWLNQSVISDNFRTKLFLRTRSNGQPSGYDNVYNTWCWWIRNIYYDNSGWSNGYCVGIDNLGKDILFEAKSNLAVVPCFAL